jgi:type II secretion system protein G
MQSSTTTERDRGFTLIELLIVIVILGILAAVTVFAVNGITDRGEESSCKAEKKTIEVALEAYNAQEGEYPANINGLIGEFVREGTTYQYWTDGASPGLITKAPGAPADC